LKCRELLYAIEKSNAEPITKIGSTLYMRLRAPNEAQLDSVYAALTKTADGFQAGSPAATLFSERAAALVHEFNTYENRGRMLMGKSDAEGMYKVSSVVEFAEEDSNISFRDGKIEIQSSETSLSTKDVGERYRHVFEGR
jgi:hypothetical protein